MSIINNILLNIFEEFKMQQNNNVIAEEFDRIQHVNKKDIDKVSLWVLRIMIHFDGNVIGFLAS